MKQAFHLLALIPLIIGPHFADAATEYPSHWWKPVPEKGAPSWEILPQAAKPGEVILSKRNELGLLSNFAATPFKLDGKTYASVEGFWQMMKYPESENDPRARHTEATWKLTRKQVAQLTAFEAKKAGDLGSKVMKEMNINWVTYNGRPMPYRTDKKGDHFNLIKRAMWAKVNQNPEVKEVLLKTGNLILKPDHHQKSPPPAWQYTKIWMEIRDQLRK